MKIKLFILIILLIPVPVFSQEMDLKLDEPVQELIFGIGEVTPPWALGVEVTYLWFPFGIPIGNGQSNLLGFGGQAGYYIEFGDDPNPMRICALFDGRFQFTDAVAMDIDTGLGFLIYGGGAGFMGTVGLGVPIRLNETYRLRPYVGMDFAGNPNYDVLDYYDNEFITWLHAGVCLMVRLGTGD